MNTDLIIWRNDQKIKTEIAKLEHYIPVFQPFVSALLKNQFKVKPTTAEIQKLIYQSGVKPSTMSIEPWLKEQALLITPAINDMPTPHSAKLMLIDASLAFSNYAELIHLYGKLPKQEGERWQISNYVLNDQGKLILPSDMVEEIESGATVYAMSEMHKNVYERAYKIMQEMITLHQETGFSFFHHDMVSNTSGSSESWLINPYTFNNLSRLNYYKTETSKSKTQ